MDRELFERVRKVIVEQLDVREEEAEQVRTVADAVRLLAEKLQVEG